ncbi:hypothetical protein Bbelb_271590 [Branchiostoma belcheri]|nr:hypothetical protein Bbelb_271590 [Branchiostoma belcheri]
MPTPSFALVMRAQSAPGGRSGTSAPDSLPQVEAESLKEVREMSPVNTTNHTMPTRTGETSTSKEVKNILNLLKQVNSKQAASSKEVQSLPPTTQPDWVFGNLAPDSPWKFNATALKEISANGATTTYGKERILAKPRFVNQTQPIEDGPPNIKMEGNDRQQANKDNITRPTNLENTTSSANVVRTVEPQTSMFASAERLSK